MTPVTDNEIIKSEESSTFVEEKLRLTSELLAQSPPGEFNDVLHDIQTILGSDELLGRLHGTVRERNVKNGAFVKVEIEGEEIIVSLTEFNELPDGRYFDPDTGAIEVESVEIDESRKCNDQLRLAIRAELQKYIKQALPKGRTQTFFDSESKKYGLILVGERFQSQNMRNGQWQSAWCIEDGKVTGTIRAIVHYFEDGNVQLNTHRDAQFEWIFTEDFENSAKELISKIQSHEDEVQVAVNEAYSQLADVTFKKLRRQLPVTRAKVDWNKLASYKVGDQLQK